MVSESYVRTMTMTATRADLSQRVFSLIWIRYDTYDYCCAQNICICLDRFHISFATLCRLNISFIVYIDNIS